jgi:hypothetical protein
MMLRGPTAAVAECDDESYSAGDGYFSKSEPRNSRMQVRSLTLSAKLLIDAERYTRWAMLQSRNMLLIFSSGKFEHYCTDPSISSTTVNFSPFWLLLQYLTVEMISFGLLLLYCKDSKLQVQCIFKYQICLKLVDS